jgi:hypothetical protein
MPKHLLITPENAGNPWHKVDAGDDAPRRFNVIIEIPMGGSNKYELARRRLRPARRIRQFDRDGCRTAGFSRLACGGTEDLMRGECLGAISILRA